VTPTEALLFINGTQVEDDVKVFLGSDVEIRPYESFLSSLSQLTTSLGASKENVGLSLYTWKHS
jgi:Xaa-Pro aminopeptidase